MRFGGLHIGARGALVALSLWAASALAAGVSAPAAAGSPLTSAPATGSVHPAPAVQPAPAASSKAAEGTPAAAAPKAGTSAAPAPVAPAQAAQKPATEPAPAQAAQKTGTEPVPAQAASEGAAGTTATGSTSALDGSKPSWETDSPENESLGWTLFRTVVVLGLVLGIIYLTLNYGLRRLMGLRPVGGGGREPLVAVMERIPLDPKRSMFVLKAAGEYLLVGGGEGSLNLICKLDPAEVARIEAARASTSPSISPFLQKLLSRRGGSPPPSA